MFWLFFVIYLKIWSHLFKKPLYLSVNPKLETSKPDSSMEILKLNERKEQKQNSYHGSWFLFLWTFWSLDNIQSFLKKNKSLNLVLGTYHCASFHGRPQDPPSPLLHLFITLSHNPGRQVQTRTIANWDVWQSYLLLSWFCTSQIKHQHLMFDFCSFFLGIQTKTSLCLICKLGLQKS